MKRFGLFAAALLPILPSGCIFDDFRATSRSQIEEPASDKDKTATIGSMSQYDNAATAVVSGYGYVTGLDGTGGSTPAGDARTLVAERLKRDRPDVNISDIVDTPNSAIVVVTGVVRSGVQRDELVDVEISLPPGSRAKSLRGGVLQPTPLMTFASQGDVRAFLKQNDFNTTTEGDRLLKGHEVAIAKGPIQAALVGPEGEAPPASDQPLKRGFVWKGAKLLEGRSMFLVLNSDQQRFRVAEAVAKRINDTFHAGESVSSKLAIARHKDVVALNVPPRYRLNHPHYMRVVRAIPLDPQTENSPFVKKLVEELENPETASKAAIGLEALGAVGMPALRSALKSEYPLVRFSAAEALAYLGQPSAAETLSKLATEHPSLQAYSLTALAALDDAISILKLEELLSASDPELRYGAFRALREIDPNSDAIRGAWAGRSYVVHEVMVSGPSLVHVLSEGRSEFVLFGAAPKLNAPFSLTAGPDMTVTARPGDTVATISRFSSKAGEPVHAQCPLVLSEILRKMAEMGATYADAADMLKKASERKALSCPLVTDALPRAVPLKHLAEAAKQDPHLEKETDLLNEAVDPESVEFKREGLKRPKENQ